PSLTLTLSVFLDSSMTSRNPLNRRTRTRIYGGVAGASGRPLPLCRLASNETQIIRIATGEGRAEIEFTDGGQAYLAKNSPGRMDLPSWALREGGFHQTTSSVQTAGMQEGASPRVLVKAGGKLGFVPAHPNDVKGKPPLNLKHGIFVPPATPGEPFQRVNSDPSQKVKLLEKAPKEFQGGSAPHLAAASAPKIEAHLMQEKISAKSPAAASPGIPRITHDYESKQFLLAEHSAGGAKSKGVTLGGITSSRRDFEFCGRAFEQV
ncbi:MAG TPA: hypothetical protein VIW93_09065, partial [Candidatus Acidoferrum sp.]